MDAIEEKREEVDSVCLLRLIEASKSMARLEFLANVIKADSKDDEPYTQDDVILQILRTAWTKRAKQIQQGEA